MRVVSVEELTLALNETGLPLSTGFESCVWEQNLHQTERTREQGSLLRGRKLERETCRLPRDITLHYR